MVVAGSSWALGPSERVDNFRLMDHTGGSHHLYYFSDMDAVVLMVQDNACSAVTAALPKYKALQEEFADKNVHFMMINSTRGDSRSSIAAAASATGIDVPVLLDEAQLVGQALGVESAGEAFVVDPKTWKLAYRGAVGADLGEALGDLLDGRPVARAQTEVDGCAVDFPSKDGHGEISYAKEVAPILQKNCVSCHRAGGIGPWAMNDYNLVLGFSPMIKEVLMTQRMPPWHADPTVGHWANDRALSDGDRRTLVNWINAGAPRGEGADPLAENVTSQPVWGDLGEPDLIIDIPPTDVPATGVVDYQYQHVKNPLDRDVWVRASQIVPGDRTVLHHVITRFGEVETEGPRAGRLKRRGGGGLAGYVPGRVARPLPGDTGTLLPAGATIQFQMHYTTSGVATTDHSRIGVYFHDEEPEHRIRSMILANPFIRIPPHAKAHPEKTERVFEKDSLVFSLLPHSHFRGKAAKFVAQYPDGSEEVLLSVPNYDFNWQTTYLLEEPKFMPAGTKIVYTQWWDNSSQNPANPDPTREVPWGQQSWDEMIFGAISYRELTEEEAAAGRQVAGSE
jgi:peroxiredoxin